MFQSRFLIAVCQKKVYAQFDGSNPKPKVSASVMTEDSTTDPTTEQVKKLQTWQDKEDLAMYLLMQKLPDSIFAKYMRKATVAEMWSAIVIEFTRKSMLMRSSLHSEFMAMRYERGTNLRSEFDHIRMKYELLVNAGITVSEDDYRTLVINFLPSELSTFIAQLSAQMKMMNIRQGVSSSDTSSTSDAKSSDPDAEELMSFALEEWDHRESYKKANNKSSGKQKETSDATAMATVSSEKPGASAGGDKGGRRKRQYGKAECWNCGSKGHRRNDCPNKKDDKDKDSSGKNEQRKEGNNSSGGSSSSSSKNKNSSFVWF
ncbi:hypothetical protein APHAL10511_006641 [Amanita phalloides]|nr:hypothetical protein APHAL10511_006641 [Amanita phalloides]